MRTLTVCLLVVLGGCFGQPTVDIPVDIDRCPPDQEAWVLVDDSSQEAVVTQANTGPDGCVTTVTTYYFSSPGGFGPGPATGLPWWYYVLGCQWDACGGPLGRTLDRVSTPTNE